MTFPKNFLEKIKKVSPQWEEMLRYSQDINVENFHGRTVIFLLCIDRHKRLIKTCISLGANINKIDKEGRSPLALFLKTGKLWGFESNYIKFLMEHGANILLTGDVDNRFYNNRPEKDYPWLLKYEFQKNLINKIPEMYVELKYVKRHDIDEAMSNPYVANLLHPEIDKEFKYLETGFDLGLLK
jgi:ankyrin repeat protein